MKKMTVIVIKRAEIVALFHVEHSRTRNRKGQDICAQCRDQFFA